MKRPTLNIVFQKVVDSKGNVIGDDPEKFSMLTNKCNALVAYLETGKEHKVV
ncbi:hypothetical protein D3C76_662710 [compost metagenome]